MNLTAPISEPLESALFEGFGRNLRTQRYLGLTGNALRSILAITPEDVAGFAAHWPRLTRDCYMGDGGTYRYRRYAALQAPAGSQRQLLPHGPYLQPRDINRLNGGMPRWFDPLESSFLGHPVFNHLLDWLTRLFDQCECSPQDWQIRVHPYRIKANAQQAGLPTPEGLHRDGVDYIISLLISRCNVEGGMTTITDNAGRALLQRTLLQPMDILIGMDTATRHAVTPVTPLDPALAAWRDVLVLGFSKMPS
jgi:hypothetical protein